MYMHYMQHMPEQIIQHMTFTQQNRGTIISWIISMIFGYLLYTEAVKLIIREKTDPYPIFLHCWMITIDCIGTVTFWTLTFKYHFFWLFVLMGVGLPIWVCMEAACIAYAIKHNRNEDFAGLTKGDVPEKQATIWALGMIAISFTVNMWILSIVGGINNAAIFFAYPFTNYVFAYWTWRTWTKRRVNGKKYGNSMSLQWVILIQLTLMWTPKLSWYLNVSLFFNEPWYYLCGLGASCLAAYNLYHLAKLPPKEKVVNGKKTVW